MTRSSVIRFLTATTAILGGLLAEPAIFSKQIPGIASQAVFAETAPAESARNLLINLSTDDTWTASMAITMAHHTLKQGKSPSVTLFLNVRGVYVASTNALPPTLGNSEQNLHEKLAAFIADGGRVIACPSCSKVAGLTQEDYLEGVILGEPGGILPLMLSPDTAIVSY